MDINYKTVLDFNNKIKLMIKNHNIVKDCRFLLKSKNNKNKYPFTLMSPNCNLILVYKMGCDNNSLFFKDVTDIGAKDLLRCVKKDIDDYAVNPLYPNKKLLALKSKLKNDHILNFKLNAVTKAVINSRF